jgi:single-stranded DNA-binding protein
VRNLNYQRIILSGNVTEDAEQKTAKSSDMRYTTFRVGVADGKDKSTFFPITVFGEYGEKVAEYLTKGRQVLVEGRISVSQNGRFNVVADQIRFGAHKEIKDKKAKK